MHFAAGQILFQMSTCGYNFIEASYCGTANQILMLINNEDNTHNNES